MAARARSSIIPLPRRGNSLGTARDKGRANFAKSKHFNGYESWGSHRINPFESIYVRETFSSTHDARFDPAVEDPWAVPPEVSRHLRCEDYHWEATTNMPHFKGAVVWYWRSCLAVAWSLVKIFSMSLDLPEDFFAYKLSHPDAALALYYYPPIEDANDWNGKERIGMPSFFGFDLNSTMEC
ncbi:hypothetical protein DL764_008968 [Monosporascus ibericus]|uniref:Uncharacterized protein n=1 Tax=Monosporascus ibericus TaxID=155417 RepID=A0A4Q4SYE5_9PEZI|nr:hypothetical protein DL764_008968 [Monosporascus ibericus]